jgi:lipoyl(octanoyl) transferase
MQVYYLGLQEYSHVFEAMQIFTQRRNTHTPDELWLVEHLPVYTQGQAGKKEHILNTNDINIIQTDRGGQVTYHGPGQLLAYLLYDLRRAKIHIKHLTCALENSIISVLAMLNIKANLQDGAPGVYVNDAKIASIGLRVKNGCTYHGIAINVNLDLGPFDYINPCGYKDLTMTQISNYNPKIRMRDVQVLLTKQILDKL